MTFNSLHPNISMHILDTVFQIFPKVLMRRICLSIKRIFVMQGYTVGKNRMLVTLSD